MTHVTSAPPTRPHPLPLFAQSPAALRRGVRHLYFDVDDTLTFEGRLPEAAALALYRAKEAGLTLVAVTGRSQAWAELLLRLFPLDAAIAETGALCLYKDQEARLRVLHSEPDAATREHHRHARERAAARVLAEVPGTRLALDNLGRAYDIAFDLVEDGPPVPEEVAQQVREILQAEGMTVAQSSVHINAWFGAFDKATMVRRYLHDVRESALHTLDERLLYVGDSRNDGAMFRAAALSVGVANIAPHLPWLQARGEAPRYLTAASGGLGFAELVDALLSSRS